MTDTIAPNAPNTHSPSSDHGGFDPVAADVRLHFDSIVKLNGSALFVTDIDGESLFETYLSYFHPSDRQVHNCSACRHFFRRAANLVSIDESGKTTSAVWPNMSNHGEYGIALTQVKALVEKSKVVGLMVSDEVTWGMPSSKVDGVPNVWTHFSLTNPRPHKSHKDAAHEIAALKKQHYQTLSKALVDFTPDQVDQVLNLLRSETLPDAQRFLGPAEFLHGIHAQIKLHGKKPDRRRNLIWRTIADAPSGFCTPRSSMIGTLLEDLANGLPFADVSAKFKAKMKPDVYQRPQAPASAGNIAQAEKLVEKLGIAPSLRRRYAQLSEIQKFWEPRIEQAEAPASGGVFAELVPKGQNRFTGIPVETPPVKITWEKFARTILPTAISMEMKLAYTMNLGAIVTSVDAEDPPILQWDHEEARNPFSWYIYTRKSSPTDWHLGTSGYVKVNAITLTPHMWVDEERYSHHGKQAIFILEGARDRRAPGLALFPAFLKAELHEIRSTIESFSGKGKIWDREIATACGVVLPDSADGEVIRVKTPTGFQSFRIDRWD